MIHSSHRFGVIDDLGFMLRSGLLILFGATCCWGFVNDNLLLIFASKVGFPMAVAVCAISVNWKQIISLLYSLFPLKLDRQKVAGTLMATGKKGFF